MQEPNTEISRDRRYNLLCIPWVLTIVVTFPGIFYPLFFPVGLFRLLGVPETKSIDQAHLLIGGWLVYIGLTAAACLSKRKRAYFIFYGLLCALLALNSFGCRAFWSDLHNIG